MISLTSFTKLSPAQFAILHPNTSQQNLRVHSTSHTQSVSGVITLALTPKIFTNTSALLLTKKIFKPFSSFMASSEFF